MRINKLYLWGLVVLVIGIIGLIKFKDNNISFISAVTLSIGFILILSSYGKRKK